MNLDQRIALYNTFQPQIVAELGDNQYAALTYMNDLRIGRNHTGEEVHMGLGDHTRLLIKRHDGGTLNLHLYHGRKTVDEHMDDWGEGGPEFQVFAVTVRTMTKDEEPAGLTAYLADGSTKVFEIVEELVKCDEMFYGDFSVALPA